MSDQSSLCRCSWVNLENPVYVQYHDEEWGKPIHDDSKLFELLVLEGAQAGLSWETILNKREAYRTALFNYDLKKLANFATPDFKKLMTNTGIVRNRLKVESVRENAKAFLEVQKEFGSFDKFIWSFVDGKPIRHRPKEQKDYLVRTELSDKISNTLKKRGFKFVGSTTCYAYMQAVGMTNDHSDECFLSKAP